ncbi:hypothetical protein WMY93_016232 [Mugilogobius chulae]|uniref:mRNA capping enzyme adenylation domain-containing protein n=1 Tax=Mugilogobius chulae TaxID=88201 RepID=A0AAW0P3K7_9GOBI
MQLRPSLPQDSCGGCRGPLTRCLRSSLLCRAAWPRGLKTGIARVTAVEADPAVRAELYVVGSALVELTHNAVFLEDIAVRGVTQITEQPKLGKLQRLCQEMAEWDKSGFPGAQPVSMDRQNLRFLEQSPYKVSWKADGTRHILKLPPLHQLSSCRVSLVFLSLWRSLYEYKYLTLGRSSPGIKCHPGAKSLYSLEHSPDETGTQTTVSQGHDRQAQTTLNKLTEQHPQGPFLCAQALIIMDCRLLHQLFIRHIRQELEEIQNVPLSCRAV